MQKKLETKPSRLQAALNYTKNAESIKKAHQLQGLVKQLEAELKLFQKPTTPEQYPACINTCTIKINYCQKLITNAELLQNPLFDPIKDALYKIIAEYVVIKIKLECKRFKSIAELLAFIGNEITYLNDCITKVQSNPALGVIQAKLSECLWMAAIGYKVELSAQITQFKSPQEDGYSSITMENWREVKALLKKTIKFFKDTNKNNDYPAVVEHLEKIADELFDLANMARDNLLAITIYDAVAATYQDALVQYTTSPDKKYAEITTSLCLVYDKKIEVLAVVDPVQNRELIIAQHEKIIKAAEKVALTTKINHATIVKTKMEARAYLFTSCYYLYQQENDKKKEEFYRVKFIDNAKEFIALAATEILSPVIRKNYDTAQKAIAQYNDENLAAGNKCCHSATQTADPKIKEALLKEAIKQFEIAVINNKKGENKINSYAAQCDVYSEMLKITKPSQHQGIYIAIFNITKIAATIKEYATHNRTLQSDIAKIKGYVRLCNEYFENAKTAAAPKSATVAANPKEANPEYEKTSNTSKARARKPKPSTEGIFSDRGTKRRKTTDTRNRAEAKPDVVQNGAAKSIAAIK